MKMISDFARDTSISVLYGVFRFQVDTHKQNGEEGHLERARQVLNRAYELGAHGLRFDSKHLIN